MEYIVTFSQELGIKSNRVRARFVRKLEKNIKAGLLASGIEGRVRLEWSRIYVDGPEGVASVLERTFGIGRIGRLLARCPSQIELLRKELLEWQHLVAGKRFRIRVKHFGGQKKFSASQLERELGSLLYPSSAGVDLKNPEVSLQIEWGDEHSHIIDGWHPGPGGLPIGTQGRALCLFSGGYDSPVASWYMYKRGLSLDFLCFNLGGEEHLEEVKRVAKALTDQWGAGSRARFFVDHCRKLRSTFSEYGAERHQQILLKRYFLKRGEELLRQQNLDALVTGEAIGQVSSQTLANLALVDQGVKGLVLRPLLGFDKNEILAKAKAIGTYQSSKQVAEHCGLSNKPPATKAYQGDIAKEEQLIFAHLPLDPLEEVPLSLGHLSLGVGRVPEGASMISVTPEITLDMLVAEIEGEPLKTYVLTCPIGMMAAVMAERLRELGYHALYLKGKPPSAATKHI